MRPQIAAIIPFLALACPAQAQEPLSLGQALDRALASHPRVQAAKASVVEASARVQEAQATYLPRVEISEAWQRGNQPVFAFGSLMAQRRFAEADFAVARLNHPDPLSNVRTAVSVEQLIFDGARARAAVKAAAVGRDVGETMVATAESDLALAVTRTYGRVVGASAARRAAAAAVASAEQDLRRAESRRDAGMLSEADVLALRVHLAEVRARQIAMAAEEETARAALNESIGAPLDTEYALEEVSPSDDAVPRPSLEALEQQALRDRPDVRRAALGREAAEAARGLARSAFWPHVAFQGIFEGNGRTFTRQVSSWTVGLEARWNVFAGRADAARLRAAAGSAARAAAEADQVERSARLDVRSAVAALDSARARVAVGASAVDQARESQRIVRDRYDAGLAGVNDVLRAADAVLQAESLRTGALVDVVVSQAALRRALGARR